MPRLTEIEWEKIGGEYIANVLSIAEIARRHGVSSAAIHKRADRHDWTRLPKEERAKKVKDRLVEEAMALGGRTTEATRDEMIEAAVNQDIQDMNLGLRNARRALNIAHNMMDAVDNDDGNPIALKSLVDTTKQSIDVIRKIRGLDEKDAEDEVQALSYDELKAEIESILGSD